MAWITTEDVYEQWLKAVDNNGDTLGFIKPSEARRLGIRTITIERPAKFIKDTYVKYHSEILMRSGILTSGRDLNEVQTVLLLGFIVNEKEDEASKNKLDFEQLLFANNPELYKNYKEQEEQRRFAENPDYEQIRPKTLNELLAMFEAFSGEAESPQDSENKPRGWLDDILDDEEISQIRD